MLMVGTLRLWAGVGVGKFLPTPGPTPTPGKAVDSGLDSAALLLTAVKRYSHYRVYVFKRMPKKFP